MREPSQAALWIRVPYSLPKWTSSAISFVETGDSARSAPLRGQKESMRIAAGFREGLSHKFKVADSRRRDLYPRINEVSRANGTDDDIEQLRFVIGSHLYRTGDTNQPGVEGYAGVLFPGTGLVWWTPKSGAVSRHKRPCPDPE